MQSINPRVTIMIDLGFYELFIKTMTIERDIVTFKEWYYNTERTISQAFHWSITKEGHDFWNYKHDLVENILKK